MKQLRELISHPRLTEGKTRSTISIPTTKPRAKDVNDTLRSKRGGKHYSPKTDYVRAKEKNTTNKTELAESSEEQHEFEYVGVSGEDQLSGKVSAPSEAAAQALIKRMHPNAKDIKVRIAFTPPSTCLDEKLTFSGYLATLVG